MLFCGKGNTIVTLIVCGMAVFCIRLIGCSGLLAAAYVQCYCHPLLLISLGGLVFIRYVSY